MKLQKTDHSYYSNDGNHYTSDGLYVAEDWNQFKSDWMIDDDLYLDHDYNHCFRFDINETYDDYDNLIDGEFSLHLYYILQRKGIYRPVHIKKITEGDMPEIRKYLESCYKYLQNQWVEFGSNKE